MTNQHPITPPPELVRQWMERTEYDEHTWFYESYIAEQAAQWGADTELEACCEVLARELICDGKHVATDLRMIRRPKPPSLKEEALEGFDTMAGIVLDEYSGTRFYEKYKKVADTVRRALEALPND